MPNGDIGLSMAESTIGDLIQRARKEREAPLLPEHCPSHQLQRDVNYALLLGMGAILQMQRRSLAATSLVSAVVAGIITGVVLAFT